MKQKDIALIVAVAGVSLVVALVLSNLLIGGGSRSQQAEVVTPISATFPQPDAKYFNMSSTNPTQVISIGNETNQTPFNTTTGQ